MRVKLVQAGAFVTREIPIEVNDFTIGREYTCDLRLDHGRISRNHCRILKRDNRVLLEALYSTAGTALNQEILDPSKPPIEVYHGDHLWVGPEHFQFIFWDDTDAPTDGLAESFDGLPENPLLKDDSAVRSRAAHQILERLSTPTRESEEPKPREPAEPPEPQGAFNVTHTDGVTLVRLLQKAIVADSDIRSITEELEELIESGQHCITLHLGNVERMSSQVIGEVFQVYRRCKAKGGMLKICQVSPQVASVFAMTNMQRHIEIFPDERLALKSVWPRRTTAIPKAVVPRPADPKAMTAPASALAHAPAATAKATPAPSLATMMATATATATVLSVRLIVEVGRSKGRAVDVRPPRFLIGRDQECHLRPNSNAISRHHAAIEQREGRVFLRDLGGHNGTILNGRVLHDEEAEVKHSDRLEIEALRFSFAIEARKEAPGQDGTDGSLSGLFNAATTDSGADTTIMALPDHVDLPTAHAAPDPLDSRPKRPRHLSCEYVRDIAVVTLLAPDLGEESILAAVRVEIETILGEIGRDRIIIRFDRVKTVSKGAVVMLLARAQHLVRTKGMMRFCGVSPTVSAFFDKTQIPLLIETYPTVQEAIRTPWEN